MLLSKLKILAAGMFLGIFALAPQYACMSYEVSSIRNRPWPGGALQSLKDVHIGYFKYQGVGATPYTRTNFYDSLAFSLVENGFLTKTFAESSAIFKKHEISADKILSPEEVLRLSGLLGGKLLLQGIIQESKTDSALEEFYQINISVYIYEIGSGEKLGEIKLFGKDLEFNTGRETLEMARLVVQELMTLLEERGQGK